MGGEYVPGREGLVQAGTLSLPGYVVEMFPLEEFRRAASLIRGSVDRTPLFSSSTFSQRLGFPIFLKLENLQRTGSFKIRGASHWLARAKAEGMDLSRGVITYSSGNHGQALAYAAQRLGIKAKVVTPEDVSALKLESMRRYGAEIEFCGRTTAQRKEKAEQLAQEGKLALVPPFDDPWIVLGQGTIALEMLEEQPKLASLLIPVGGGGLISGNAIAAKALSQKIQIIGIEPEQADSLARSLEEKKRVSIQPGNTLADGLRSSSPGELNFKIASSCVDQVLRVKEEEILRALQMFLFELKLLVEPSAAVGLAAVLSGRFPIPEPCGMILSGGNIGHDILTEMLHRI